MLKRGVRKKSNETSKPRRRQGEKRKITDGEIVKKKSKSTQKKVEEGGEEEEEEDTEEENDDEGDKKKKPITVVMCSVKKFIKDVDKENKPVFDKIKKDVAETSTVNTEFGELLIKFELVYQLEHGLYDPYENHVQLNPPIKTIDFLAYFYKLLNNKTLTNVPDQYESMRNSAGLPRFYEKKLRANLFRGLVKQYKVKFERNIKHNAFRRVRKYIKTFTNCKDYKELTRNTEWLFNADAEESWKSLDFGIRHWDKGYFANVNPYKHLYDFFLIWKYYLLNDEGKNFSLIPTNDYNLTHISYDKQAFYQLLCSVKKCPQKPGTIKEEINQTFKEFKLNPKDYFNLPRKTLKYKSFSTNSVVCAVRFYCKPKSETIDMDVEPIKNLPCVGIDPGQRIFVGATRYADGNPYNNQEPNRSNILYSTKEFYRKCGHYTRTMKRTELTNHIEERIQEERQKLEKEIKELKQTDWFEWWRRLYIEFNLKWFMRKIAAYHNRKVTRLKFDAYIRRKKTINEIIKKQFIAGEVFEKKRRTKKRKNKNERIREKQKEEEERRKRGEKKEGREKDDGRRKKKEKDKEKEKWERNKKRRKREKKLKRKEKREKMKKGKKNKKKRKRKKKLKKGSKVKKEVNVFIGNGTLSSNSPIKGYIRTPGKEFMKELIKHPKVQVFKIDEHNTTQMCAKCKSGKDNGKLVRLKIAHSPHRYAVCSTCHISWNRDTNAAYNMALIGYQTIIRKNESYSLRS